MTMINPRFDLTTEGYQDAVKFLKQIGIWEKVSTTGFSVDGYSIIHEANSIYEKLKQEVKVAIKPHFAGHYRLEYDGKYVTLFGWDKRYEAFHYGFNEDTTVDYEEMVLIPVVIEVRYAEPKITGIDNEFIYISLLPEYLINNLNNEKGTH